MKSFSIKTKILIGLIPLVFLFVLFGIYIKEYKGGEISNSQKMDSVFEKNKAVVNFRSVNRSLSDVTRLYALTGDSQHERKRSELLLTFYDTYDYLLKQEANKAESSLLEQYKKNNDSLKDIGLLIFDKAQGGDFSEAVNIFDSVYSQKEQEADKLLTMYLDEEQNEVYDSLRSNLEYMRKKQINFIFFTLIFIVITAIFLYFILRNFIIVPIVEMTEVALRIKNGDLYSRVAVRSKDEVGRLGTYFNEMTAELQEEIRKRGEENKQLVQLDEKKSQFISVVAHQLRTPLSGIKWTLNMAISGELGPLSQDLASFLNKSYESNERMISLVNDMLGVSRLESGRFQYNFTYIDLRELAEKAISEMYAEAMRKKIRIDFSPATDPLLAYCDPEKISQVFQNLIENSIRYTPVGGFITINIKRDGEKITSTVKDSGIGIPKKDQTEIFTRFFRSSNAVKFESNGSGLGLFIVKSIIDKNNGKVWFESEEGKGSSFHFTLPVGPVSQGQSDV